MERDDAAAGEQDRQCTPRLARGRNLSVFDDHIRRTDMIDDERMKRIRQRQQEHNEAIESVTWFTPSQLAKRWSIGLTTVMNIPREALPYRPFGLGKRPRRRYSPEAVAAFERSGERYS